MDTVLNLLLILLSANFALRINCAMDFKEDSQDTNHSRCTCAPYYQCSEETGNIITNGDGLLDYRMSKCTGYFDVCCNLVDVADDSEELAISSVKGCGYLKQMTVPWSGVLLINSKPNPESDDLWEHKCGLSIIHPWVVLTAAHCLEDNPDMKNYKVQIARNSWKVSKAVVHANFNYGTLHNDIALLFLETPLNFENICIPPPGSRLDFDFAPTRCIVTTWKGNKLAMLEMPLVSKPRCENSLKNTRLGQYFKLHSSFLCAGGDAVQDTCLGDGGSPLICPVPGQPGRFHQVGIVSWGIGCGANNTPGVYVNVAKFRNWIDEQLKENSLELHFYRY